MPRRYPTLALAGALSWIAVALPVSAMGATVEANETVARDCSAKRLAAGAPGVDHQRWTAPAAGFLTVTAGGGPRGDWDLALFRRGERRAAAASTSFGSDERAQAWVRRGEAIVAQACRRRGGPARLPLDFDLFRLSDVPEIPDERYSLESVPISGPEDLERLEALGLDVTHDVSQTDATVATYSEAERALLAVNGFEATTLIADLVEADAADREREAKATRRASHAKRGGPTLPSGRTAYRQYSDYTTEMKDLAEDHPAIAREVTIGTSVEGLPVQGLEIAGNVAATDDGRPVYLNMGVHHAREWPAGELPMEFAIDLVEGYGSNTRITNLLDDVRVFVFPVVNPDGFTASRSFGPDNGDDGPLPSDQLGAYKRKNCRPLNEAEAMIPCGLRTSSGVDLNRNYGAYWGGADSSSDVSAQNYRGPSPYSEPESEAVHQFTSDIHPTVFITNHTFTDDGKWMRQPGFDDVITVSPDEVAMKDLGDDMAAATGWTSELGYETLGDITGATEDWNYFAQGTYGYTPETRGVNFHPNYADAVIEEYLGDAQHPGLGVREAFLIAGERAGDATEHSVLQGAAPATATLRLHKEFQTPTCVGGPPPPCSTPSLFIDDVLDTTLDVPASGQYSWHVNPSGRPLHQAETWTMSCELPGEDPVSVQVAVDRGEAKTVDWDAACATDQPPPPNPMCRGEEATILGTAGDDRGVNRLVGSSGEDVIVGLRGRDVIRGVGEDDVLCGGGGADRLRGNDGFDNLYGDGGRDHLVGGANQDSLRGGRGHDRCRADAEDTLRGCVPNG